MNAELFQIDLSLSCSELEGLRESKGSDLHHGGSLAYT